MCDPVSLGVGSFAIGGAQAIAGYASQRQAADRQNAYSEQNRAAAIQALTNSYAGAQNQITEERSAASHSLLETEIKGAAARGTARVAAGQGGVDGSASVNALMQDYFAREGRSTDAINENYDMTSSNIRSNMLSSMGTAQSRINSVQHAVQPNFFDAGLRIAGAAVGGAGQYYRDTNLQRGWNNPYGSNSAATQTMDY